MSPDADSRSLAVEQPFYTGRERVRKAQAQAQGGTLKKLGEALLSEAFVGNLLRYGVFASVAVCAIGAIMFFVDYGLGGNVQSIIQYSANPAFPHSIAALEHGVAVLDPLALSAAGLLLLVALRVMQVLLSAVTFGVRGNYKFVGISLFVFAVLVSSLFLGKAGG